MYKDYPLTKQQLGLWIEQRLHPRNTSYNTCVKVKLTGKLDVERFRNASRDVIQYFDTLKVYFVEKDGVPYQRIDDEVDYIPEYTDISQEEKTETLKMAIRAKEILSDKLHTAIDLTQFPIMRASLIKVAEEVYYFIGMVPHIVSDGRAAILYLESLSIAYNCGAQGLIDKYGKTRKNWQDFFKAGLHEIDPEVYNENKQHWKSRLKNANHYFDYSYGKLQVDPNDKRGERVYFDLSEGLSQKIKAHSKSQRTTLFNVFVCAFSIFIHKYFQRDDILIGYPINIRPAGYKHFFGFFVNILPIRVDMRGDPSYLELLSKIHQVRKEDKKHQKYPALDIVSDIRESLPDFDGRVFNLSMAQTVSRLFDLDLEGIDSQPLDSEYYDVNDDFSLSYELIEQRIGLWFEYRKALFDREFINQAMEHIESIIEQVLDFPERKLSEFQLLTVKQKLDIFRASQNIEKSISITRQKQTVVSMFELQAEKTPFDIAVVDNENRFTYQELGRRANQLANKIEQASDGSQNAIAVSLERGIDLIVSLLAVLKSGNYYVPIPLHYPKKRVTHILNDAKVSVWVFDADSCREIIRNNNTSAIVAMDLSEVRLLKPENFDSCFKNIDPSYRAYTIYTSGSTGTPKGVNVSHDNLTSRLQWLTEYFNFSNKDRVLQNTDFSFDVSVAEMFWPLVSGASLVIANQQKNRDAKYLLSVIQDEQITCCCMVPSLLRALINFDKNQQLSSIRQVLSAGEPLSTQLKNDFYANSSTTNAKLYNFYGPTEATIYASFEKTSRDINQPVTIGRPLGETSLFVLDKQLNILPTGVVGELYIGGSGIAEGYQSNIEQTRTAFINDPYSTNEINRLYRSGDLARYNFNGDLEYIGRVDRQIKIRGFRVELEEIESTILLCEDILDVAMVDYKIDNNQAQLVAYYVVRDEADKRSTLDRIKKYIDERLPNYMMPSLFIPVKKIPRLLSGKLDKLKLPAPLENITAGSEFRPATNDMEIALVNIWSGILSIDSSKISINSSFFDLGGDSLMAIQFVSVAESKGLYFDIGDLFEVRNIKFLALVAKHSPPVHNPNKEVSGSYPLLPRQVKFFEDNFINPHHWNRTFSFSLNHDLNLNAFALAVNAVLEHHENLRVKFLESEENGWQQHCEPIDKNIDLASKIFRYFNFADLEPHCQRKKITDSINHAHKEIKLSDCPLIRIVHFTTGKQKGHMAIVFHHLLLDMVSSRLIFEDLILAYEMARHKTVVKFPGKTTSVKKWVSHLIELSKQKDFSKSLSYWQKMPIEPQPSLPLDSKADKFEMQFLNNEASARLKAFSLDVKSTQNILQDLTQITGMPIQDFLLASLFETISGWTGVNSMMVSTCGHGREINSEQFNLSRTVGWLNTVFPVHLCLPKNQLISELDSFEFLENIRQQLSKVPEDNIDYNILRYYLKHPKIIQHSTPNLFFNYVGQLDSLIPAGAPFTPSLDLPGLAGIDGNNHLCYQLYFEAGVIGGRLTFRLTYSENLFSDKTINHLVESLLNHIKIRLQDVCINEGAELVE